jgi:hypothetical protein
MPRSLADLDLYSRRIIADATNQGSHISCTSGFVFAFMTQATLVS